MKSLLVDTHALVWALHAPAKLSKAARNEIEDGGNLVYFSSASIWELAIKSAKGLIEIEQGFIEAIQEAAITELPVRASHAWQVRGLPMIHGDPFDRILVAQAQMERLILVTRDQHLEAYGIATITA